MNTNKYVNNINRKKISTSRYTAYNLVTSIYIYTLLNHVTSNGVATEEDMFEQAVTSVNQPLFVYFSSSSKGVFIWRIASPIGRASPLCRDPASQLNTLTKFVFVYMRGGPALVGGISLLTTEISPRRAGNFHINALKRAGALRRASKSKLRTHDKVCLGQHFLGYFSFHKLCLFMCRI